jgi:hypothetical protein
MFLVFKSFDLTISDSLRYFDTTPMVFCWDSHELKYNALRERSCDVGAEISRWSCRDHDVQQLFEDFLGARSKTLDPTATEFFEESGPPASMVLDLGFVPTCG